MTSQTAAAPTAVMVIDIAIAVAMSLTHSQIVTVAFLVQDRPPPKALHGAGQAD